MGIIHKQLGVERVKIIAELYKDNKGLDFLTIESDTIFYLDIDKNTIFYTIVVLEECGCCDRMEEENADLDIYLGYMSESEFNEFVEHIKIICK